jgi:hypothetical protein
VFKSTLDGWDEWATRNRGKVVAIGAALGDCRAMRYFALMLMLVAPSLGAAGAIDSSSRYLCETETAVGWTGKDDNILDLQVTSPRTKFIIEPVDMIKTVVSTGPKDGSEAKISHRVTELGDPKVEFLCVKADEASELTHCFGESDNQIFTSGTPFLLNTDAEEGKILFTKNRMETGVILSTFKIWRIRPFEMGFCQQF